MPSKKENKDLEITEDHPSEPTPSEFDEILEYVPEDQRSRVSMIMQKVTRNYSGPIPHAEDMAKYKEVDPSFPERMLSMAEKQLEHRQSLEEKLVVDDFKLKNKGQNYALLSLFSLASIAFGLIYVGATTEAATVAGVAIVGVVGIFVTGRYRPANDD